MEERFPQKGAVKQLIFFFFLKKRTQNEARPQAKSHQTLVGTQVSQGL